MSKDLHSPSSAELRAAGRYVVTYTRPFKFPGEDVAQLRTAIFGDYGTRPEAEAGLAALKREYYWRPDHQAELLEPTNGTPPAAEPTPDFTFELSPCAAFLGVRFDGQVIGMIVPGESDVWTASYKRERRTSRNLLELCAWLLSHSIGLGGQGVPRA